MARDQWCCICSGLAFLFGGLFLSPDLDINSRPYQRWGVLRWIVVALPTPDPSPLGVIAQPISWNGHSDHLSQLCRGNDQLARQPLGHPHPRAMGELAAADMEPLIQLRSDRCFLALKQALGCI